MQYFAPAARIRSGPLGTGAGFATRIGGPGFITIAPETTFVRPSSIFQTLDPCIGQAIPFPQAPCKSQTSGASSPREGQLRVLLWGAVASTHLPRAAPCPAATSEGQVDDSTSLTRDRREENRSKPRCRVPDQSPRWQHGPPSQTPEVALRFGSPVDWPRFPLDRIPRDRTAAAHGDISRRRAAGIPPPLCNIRDLFSDAHGPQNRYRVCPAIADGPGSHARPLPFVDRLRAREDHSFLPFPFIPGHRWRITHRGSVGLSSSAAPDVRRRLRSAFLFLHRERIRGFFPMSPPAERPGIAW